MSFAKGVTSGYLPLGGIQISDEIREAIMSAPPNQRWMHAYTYSGHATCCAVALTNLDILENEKLVGRAAEMGQRLLVGMEALRDIDCVGDVRGLGLMCGVEFVADRDSKAWAGIAEKIRIACEERGLISRTKGESYLLAPPLVVSAEEIDQMLAILRESIEGVWADYQAQG
jgi:adenosylmethionine-8-amino-7-oxononanoate aminotransferase